MSNVTETKTGAEPEQVGWPDQAKMYAGSQPSLEAWAETHAGTSEGETWAVQRMYWTGVWESENGTISSWSMPEYCHSLGWE